MFSLIARRRASEEGQALVMVLGMILLMGVVLTVIASSTIFGAYFTTQTRASVESQAAADGGVSAIYAGLATWDESDSSTCPVDDLTGTVTSSAPAFEATLEYQLIGATGDEWLPGCPPSADVTARYRVTSTGSAAQPGAGGYDGGDETTVVSLWERPVDPPAFEHAIRGDVSVSTAGIAGIYSDPDDDASVYTKGDFTCPSGFPIQGSVFAGGDVKWTSPNCRVTEDVVVGGDLQFNVGNGSVPVVGGNLLVHGNIVHSLGTSFGNFDTGWNGNTQHPWVGGEVRAGGLIDAYCAYDGHAPNSNWSGYTKSPTAAQCGTNTGSRVQIRATSGIPDIPSDSFLPVDADYAGFADWNSMEWDTMTGVAPGSVPDGRRIDGGTCKNHPWNGKAVITITENTVIDTTDECTSGILLGDYGGLTINLGADLALIGHYFKQNGKTDIISTDGNAHSLYLVDPPSPGFAGCVEPVKDPSATNGGFQLSSGDLNVPSNVAILAYTPGSFVAARSNLVWPGQVYSCKSHLASGFYLDFRRVGEVSSNPPLTSFEHEYIRQG